jgi:hypothetical protein
MQDGRMSEGSPPFGCPAAHGEPFFVHTVEKIGKSADKIASL